MRRTLYFYALAASSSEVSPPPGIAVLSHDELVADGPAAAAAIRLAYAGDASYGLLIVKDIPGFSEARRAAMNATIRMARGPPPHSRRSRSTWPGFRSDQDVDDPLQGGFLHNPLEDIGRARVDPVFGKTPWPNADFKSDIVRVNRLIWNVTLAVLKGTDRLIEEETRKAGTAPPQVPLSGLMQQSDFLYFLMKGLEQLPPASETVYRGIPGAHLAMVRSRYLLGSDVHWSAFNSTSTSIDKAKRFAQGPVGRLRICRVLRYCRI